MFDLKEKPIAHRGYFGGDIVENTLEAFDNAVKHNYNVELDVQLTKDLELVIAHDLHLRRIAGKDLRIKDLTYNELKEIKLNDHGAIIPKFSDVLKLIDGKINIVVELKNIDHKLNKILAKKVVDLLHNYKGDYVVQSFNPFIVRRIRLLDKTMHRGQLVGNYEGMPRLLSFPMRSMITNIFSRPEFLDTDIHFSNRTIKRYLRKGKPVISYTAKSKEDYIKYMNIYDNVIFQDFDPEEIFYKQIVSK